MQNETKVPAMHQEALLRLLNSAVELHQSGKLQELYDMEYPEASGIEFEVYLDFQKQPLVRRVLTYLDDFTFAAWHEVELGCEQSVHHGGRPNHPALTVPEGFELLQAVKDAVVADEALPELIQRWGD